MQSAIVILVDSLNPSFLSPFGCTWTDTPAFDQLAAEGITFENSVAESVCELEAWKSVLTGLHPLDRSTDQLPDDSGLAHLLSDAVESHLFTDHETDAAASWGFERVWQLRPLENETPVNSIADTVLAHHFAEVLDLIPKLVSPYLCVIRLSSLGQCWDAPVEMRERFRDEEDPSVLTSTQPPFQTGGLDPDDVLLASHAYAAQLQVLDACLQVLLVQMQADGMLDNTNLFVGGIRGLPVGHQGRCGHDPSHLFSDATRVPLFIRPANESPVRWSPCRIHPLLPASEWFQYVQQWTNPGLGDKRAEQDVTHLMPGNATKNFRPIVVGSTDSAQRAIWTPAWQLVASDERHHLFVKPDDRWDINPVQDRCRQVAEELREILAQSCDLLAQGKRQQLPLLAGQMVTGLD